MEIVVNLALSDQKTLIDHQTGPPEPPPPTSKSLRSLVSTGVPPRVPLFIEQVTQHPEF